VLAHVATVTSSLLAYMLLYMLGLLRQRNAARLAAGALAWLAGRGAGGLGAAA
jgi:hypothetical protein